MKFKRVALYARNSTQYQNVENQLSPMREFSARRGWSIVAEHVDPYLPGNDGLQPELERVMALARQRKIDVLLVCRFDRLARKFSKMALALEELQSVGVELVSVEQPFDTQDPYGKFAFTIAGALSEYESTGGSPALFSGWASEREVYGRGVPCQK